MSQQELDLAEIKRYNSQVRELQEQAKRVRLEREIAEKQLNEECKELSALLGEEVTPSNLESVYARIVASIKETMDRGNEIIASIAKQATEAANETVSVGVAEEQAMMTQEPDISETANGEEADSSMDEFAELMMGSLDGGNSANAGQAATPVQPVVPIQPVAPIQPITPISPVMAAQPVTNAQAVNPVLSGAAVQPINPVQAVNTIQPIGGADMPTFGAPTFNMPNFN